MKRLSFAWLIAMSALFFQACGDSNNTDDNAIESNTTTDNTSTSSNNADGMGHSDTTTGLNNNSSLNKSERFMVEAASGGMMEVDLGNLAKEKATNAKVKEFAAMMVKDHTKANDELKALASKKNVTLPATMEDKHREHINDLRDKSGAEFDKDYMEMMVKDHKDDIDKFEDIAKNSDDADLKAFANKTLPVLRKHHEQAKQIEDSLKK